VQDLDVLSIERFAQLDHRLVRVRDQNAPAEYAAWCTGDQ